MLTGERRQVPGRRGMTVLGKIPAVPKPINLPSQRLENGGLDPNVELVPRGSVSWGAAGRSPPSASSPWGNAAQSSSPPVSGGSWGVGPPRPLTAGGHVGSSTPSSGPGTGGSGAWGSHALRPSSAGSGARPSSAGSGTRPSSAGSLRQTQDAMPVTNAWGPAAARPSSASGVLGQAQSQPSSARPRSAETGALGSQGPPLTRFAEQSSGPTVPSPTAWGASRKTGEEPHQPSRFTLTRVDFPTLGSEKNPDLRPQQSKSGNISDRAAPVDERGAPAEDRPPLGPTGPYDEMPPASGGGYGGQERISEGWRRDGRPYGGHSGMAEGNWHRDGPPPIPPFGQPQGADTWRREPAHGGAPGGGPSDDNWRRGGPPVGPYGPPGPGRFQPQPAGFMHQQRYGPGPGSGPYGGRGGGDAGPGGYNRHGDMYANAPFGRHGNGAPPRAGPPMGSIYEGPVPYDYYGPPGPGYGNMDEREMMMLGMNGPPGMYGNYPQGPPVDAFNRYPHAGPPSGPRHMNNFGSSRDRVDAMGFEGEGYREGPKYKENNFKDGVGFKDGGGTARDGREGFGEVSRDRFNNEEKDAVSSFQDSGDNSRTGSLSNTSLMRDGQRPSSRGSHLGVHRDWGAAASNDEPMDFSKPVFEEEVTSASPGVGTIEKGSAALENDVNQGEGDVAHKNSKTEEFVSRASVPEMPENIPSEIGATEETLKVELNDVNKDEYVQTRKSRDGETGVTVSKRIGNDHTTLSDSKDKAERRTPGSENIEPPERRWGRESRMSRERNFGRDSTYASHGRIMGSRKDGSISAATSSTVRTSSQHTNDGLNSRPKSVNITAGSLQSPATRSALTEEITSSSSHEKHGVTSNPASNPTSPSGSDSQTNDKLRILKRAGDDASESTHSDLVNIVEESSHADILVVTGAVESVGKDDLKTRGKSLNSHDGEKEWRPKISSHSDLPADPSQSSSASSKQSTLASAVDKVGADVGGLTSGDSYDYEAQRAKMKEIAAQRAIQLRKEEDERSKEQKAKALAKLEELNRRSLASPASQPAQEPAVIDAVEEPAHEDVPQDDIQLEIVKEQVVVLENSSSGVGLSVPRGGRNGRNEHGKRERVGDRKSNGRTRDEHRAKMGSAERRELTKGRLTASSSQAKLEPPAPPPARVGTSNQAVPSPPSAARSDSIASVVETGSVVTQVQPVPSKAQETRLRGRQAVSQPKHGNKQLQSSVEGEQTLHAQENAAESTGKNGVWPVGTGASLDHEPRESTFLIGSSGTNTDSGATGARKKKTKNTTRHKQKPEGLSVSSDFPATVEQNQNFDLSSSNDSGNETGKPSLKTGKLSAEDETVKKEVSSLVPTFDVAVQQPAGTESSGIEAITFRSNGDVPNRKPQRKPQTGRRITTRERVVSQDVRVGDKPHGSAEGMIWAPVRSPSNAHPAASKGAFPSEGAASGTTIVERKEETVVPPPMGRARRAELERYTPKPVVKQQAQQQEELQQQQQQQQQVTASASQPQGPGGTDVSAPEVQEAPTPVAEVKFGSEARQAENIGKQGRGHTSWRQRGSGSERPAVAKDSHNVHQSESVETAFRPQQHGTSSQAQHNHHRNAKGLGLEQSRPSSAQYARSENVGRRSHPQSLEEKEQVTQDPQLSRGASAGATVAEKESKATQEVVSPYQAPRPGSGQKNRGLENDGQGSVEQGVPYRSNISHADRQQGVAAKYDRDQHSSHERGPHHPHPRSHASRHQGSSGPYERDSSQAQSGSQQQLRPTAHSQSNTGEGSASSRDKDQKSTYVGSQGKGSLQSAQGQSVAAVAGDRDQSIVDHGTNQQRRSPARHRPRQQNISHDREQPASAPHSHQQSRYRQSDRDHQRDVSNTVQPGQQKGGSDSHWQQTGSSSSEQSRPKADQSRSNEVFTRSTSQKLQATIPASGERDHHPSTNRLDSHGGRSQGSYAGDSQKQTPFESVSHHQRPHQHQQGAPHGISKGDPVQSGGSHANGERAGSPPAYRSRDVGHPRRGRFSGRFAGMGRGRAGETENKKEQPVKQRMPVDTGGGAVVS